MFKISSTLIENSLGDAVTIGTTEYAVPADGYFKIHIESHANNYCFGYVNNIVLMRVTTPPSGNFSYEDACVFVRKGMKIKISTNHIEWSWGNYYPLKA